jgi:hypothetical protein
MVSPPLGLVWSGICFFATASWFAHQRISSHPGAAGALIVKTTRYSSAGQVHFTSEPVNRSKPAVSARIGGHYIVRTARKRVLPSATRS